MTTKTYQEIKRIIEELSAFASSNSIESISTAVIRSWLQGGIINKGWEPKTFHIYWQYSKTFFEWCVKRKYLVQNPVTPIEKPRLKKPLQRCLTNDDALRVLNGTSICRWRYQFEKVRNEAMIATFLRTGIRLRELINLRLSDVDLNDGTIFILRGKGGKDRYIPIHRQLRPILERYARELKRWRRNEEWFFPSLQHGKQIAEKTIRRICMKVSLVAGVKFTPHMLRHTFGREMTDKDFPIFKLKEVMGHSSILTTQRYQSVSQEGTRRSFDRIEMY